MRHRHLVSSALEVPRPTVGDRTAARAGPAFGRKGGEAQEALAMSAMPDAAAQGVNRANTLRIAARHAPAPPSLPHSLKMAVERAGWTRGGSDAIDARRRRGSGAQLGSRWGCAAVVASLGAAGSV